MVELGTHNLCPLTNEVEECILGDGVFKTGIMRSRSYKSVLALLHITAPHFWYGWQHQRYFPQHLRRAEFARQVPHVVVTAFSVSRNSLVRFSSLPINSDSFTFILENTTNSVRFS
jgi:hypothetical protein